MQFGTSENPALHIRRSLFGHNYEVRIFRALTAPFIDMSRETATLETCPKARHLPERGNADTKL